MVAFGVAGNARLGFAGRCAVLWGNLGFKEVLLVPVRRGWSGKLLQGVVGIDESCLGMAGLERIGSAWMLKVMRGQAG